VGGWVGGRGEGEAGLWQAGSPSLLPNRSGQRAMFQRKRVQQTEFFPAIFPDSIPPSPSPLQAEAVWQTRASRLALLCGREGGSTDMRFAGSFWEFGHFFFGHGTDTPPLRDPPRYGANSGHDCRARCRGTLGWLCVRHTAILKIYTFFFGSDCVCVTLPFYF